MSQPWDQEFRHKEATKKTKFRRRRLLKKIDQIACGIVMVLGVYVLVAKYTVKQAR